MAMNDQVKQTTKELENTLRHSYLLRLWRNTGPGGFNWQASLETPKTGERIGFPSLEELFAYLMDLTTTNKL
jgi:hypothetical protein